MSIPTPGRRSLLAWPLLCLLVVTPTLAAPASTLSAAAKTTSSPPLGSALKAEDRAAMLAFDAVYIPALFLTGSAGKSAEGPGQARAAMARVLAQWPAHRSALQAAAPKQAVWWRALEGVQKRLKEAEGLVDQGQWEASHEALEHVRELQFEARQSLGMDYALDHFTAFHGAMERLANAKAVDRPALVADFARASALWRPIETLQLDAEYRLSPAQLSQLNSARQDESAALSRLSQALRQGSDAEVLKAAAATKPPFIKAYLAFGSKG